MTEEAPVLPTLEKVEVIVGETNAGDDKTRKVKLTKRGVLIEDANGNDVYVQPESLVVWLDHGCKLK